MRCTNIFGEKMKSAGVNIVLVLLMVSRSFALDPDTSVVEILTDDPILAALDSMAVAKFFDAS